MPRTPHFVQITALGWTRFDTLVAWNGTTARLWTRLARSIDGQGVVITTAVALATDLGVSAATVRRHLAHLESVRAFVRFRLPGGLTAFAMNPNEVWSGKSNARARAPYCTGVLGGDREGQASLRRGAWFLPGMEPVIPKKTRGPRRPAQTAAQDTRTGDLFDGLDCADTPSAASVPHTPPPTPTTSHPVKAPAAPDSAPVAPLAPHSAQPRHAKPIPNPPQGAQCQDAPHISRSNRSDGRASTPDAGGLAAHGPTVPHISAAKTLGHRAGLF